MGLPIKLARLVIRLAVTRSKLLVSKCEEEMIDDELEGFLRIKADGTSVELEGFGLVLFVVRVACNNIGLAISY